jgi:feruloyl esterase
MNCVTSVLLFVCLVLAGAAQPGHAGETLCPDLMRLSIADVVILSATETAPEAPGVGTDVGASRRLPMCRVSARIDTEIHFELWLPPPADWNHKFLAGGVGGQAGQLNYRELTRALNRGYAAASTDTGHLATDHHWLLGSPERAVNFAYRANHLLAEKSKLIVRAYYGSAAQHAYFVGCSGGGRQALTEAQRFPGDYDGVIAGAPGTNTPEMSARRMWEMIQHSDHAGLMSNKDWSLIAEAAVKECDAADGVSDGIIENPSRCQFHIERLKCRASETGDCLSEAQVNFARTLYAPLIDETGHQIDPGLLPGVEISPTMLPEPFTPGPPYLAIALFGDGVHRDVNWNQRSFNIAADLAAANKVMDLHADNPDLHAFAQSGGKLILYQGWADPLVAAQPTVAYFQSINHVMGIRQSGKFVRLYMVPGMKHCVGGAGADQFGGAGGDGPSMEPDHNLLTALENWVERGVGPQTIVASKLAEGAVIRSHPLCPYPQEAHFVSGDPTNAASYRCR